jgi:5-methylcytosine-specific restriction endonuclease McrA
MLWVTWATQIREIDSDIASVCDQIITRVCPDGNKEAKIRALKEYLQQDVHATYVAEAVGCCEAYARNFGWDETEADVFEKTYAKNRRKQQVDSVKRNRVVRRDSNTCVWCGKFGGRNQVHHVIPVSRGGTDAMENLALLCHRCHSEAHRGNGHGGVSYDSPDEFWDRSRYSTPPDGTGDS